MTEPTLTKTEKAQIRAIKKHLENVDYASFSGDAIRKLFQIVDRLTAGGQEPTKDSSVRA